MDGVQNVAPTLEPRTKLLLLLAVLLLCLAFLLLIRSILFPFLWALVAAYLLVPVVNYLSVQGRLPRLWSVIVLYLGAGLLLLASSRYLYPRLSAEVTVFLEDIPRLEVSLIALVGPRPIGIDIASVINGLLQGFTHSTSAGRAGTLIASAATTVVKTFLFLVATFYLLLDAPRLSAAVRGILPPEHQPELLALGRKINLTWQQYIRGELVLFAIMATATSIGLTILGVPGAIFLGLVSGSLELLPVVGPFAAGALAVSVAYVNGTNPFGWSQVAYAAVVALMYFVFRQAEDYFVVPNVLGRAVRLHPLVVLFSVAAGGVIAGLFGLVVAVPIAASVKAILSYLYCKLLDRPVQFEPIRTLGGGIIEIPVHGGRPAEESPAPEGAGTSQA